MNNLEFLYRDWLVNELRKDPLGSDERYRRPYKRLLNYLWDKEFYYTLDMDKNRADDGIYIRRIWAEDHGYDSRPANVDFGPCRVIEVLYGLVLRIEHVIHGSVWSDQLSEQDIFFDLVGNLGLLQYKDSSKFWNDKLKINEILEKWMDREYENEEIGALFPVETDKKLEGLELWSQMHMYISDKWPI